MGFSPYNTEIHQFKISPTALFEQTAKYNVRQYFSLYGITHAQTQTRAHTHTHTHARMHARTHAYTHTHTHTHTHTQSSRQINMVFY